MNFNNTASITLLIAKKRGEKNETILRQDYGMLLWESFFPFYFEPMLDPKLSNV